MGKLMIEAALNEGIRKETNLNVPYAPEEIPRDAIACANARAMGGRIRTGLGDAPMLDGRTPTNVEMVKMAVDAAHMAGREVASIDEARRMVGMSR